RGARLVHEDTITERLRSVLPSDGFIAELTSCPQWCLPIWTCTAASAVTLRALTGRHHPAVAVVCGLAGAVGARAVVAGWQRDTFTRLLAAVENAAAAVLIGANRA
ncbi:MAG: hypothetical protein ACRCW4_14205, partial [Candidatus Neomicrothrix subdominans]